MATKRISYIDMAKGIGIILVVFGHTSFPSRNLTDWINSFHMPLFFLLSGMLLSHNHATEQSMSSFIRKKAKGILIPYLTFSVLSILFAAVLDSATFRTYLPNALTQSVVFYGISVLWFLPALFFGEVIFLFIRKHTSLVVSALLSVGICLLTVFAAHTYHYNYVTDFGSYLSVLGAYLIAVIVRTGMAVTFLALGYFTQHLFFKKEHSKILYGGLAVLFLALNIFLAFKNISVDLNNLVFGYYQLYFPAAFCGGMFVICLCAALPSWAPLTYIGKNSLIIMATHMNCRFLGLCYAVGNLALKILPFLGNIGYMLVVLATMAVLEAVTIYVINHYFPFLIGVKKSR
ncbi:MAG: acyltransferase family protein [Roseburia sp.]|nr:acyltransferase family protein [Roseburia sp.]